MKDSEINEYLADLKELTDIESPTSCIDGVNEVAAWFKKRAEILGLKSRSIELGTDKVAPAFSSQMTLRPQTTTFCLSDTWIPFFLWVQRLMCHLAR